MDPVEKQLAYIGRDSLAAGLGLRGWIQWSSNWPTRMDPVEQQLVYIRMDPVAAGSG